MVTFWILWFGKWYEIQSFVGNHIRHDIFIKENIRQLPHTNNNLFACSMCDKKFVDVSVSPVISQCLHAGNLHILLFWRPHAIYCNYYVLVNPQIVKRNSAHWDHNYLLTGNKVPLYFTESQKWNTFSRIIANSIYTCWLIHLQRVDSASVYILYEILNNLCFVSFLSFTRYFSYYVISVITQLDSSLDLSKH